MVQFDCDNCGATLKKKQVASHFYKCGMASVSCTSCSAKLPGDDYIKHTVCITESDKYHGKWSKSARKAKLAEREANRKEKKAQEEKTKEEDKNNKKKKR